MENKIEISPISFSKILVQKKEKLEGKISISQNIHFSSFERIDENTLKISFSFQLDYKEFAQIILEGYFHLKSDKKILKNILEGWDKKNLDPSFQNLFLNIILNKCVIKSLLLEEEFGLPLHIKINTLPKQN
ncbi:MAG: hypothetical protein QW273_00275 [Candidatus Pacearchaeota archaeon]